MNLKISFPAACTFARLAVIARVACGIVLDMPELLNAGWLSILLGGILAFPPIFAVEKIKRQSNYHPRRLLCLAFFIIFIYESAAVCAVIADSASFMALNSTAAVYLMLPQLLLCLVCLRLNGDALGSSAGIWCKILPCLLALVFLLQAKAYRPGWLTPLLGPGFPSILKGAIRAAGWFTLPIGLYLVSECSDEKSSTVGHPLRILCTCIVAAALIALSFSMMTPSMTDKNLFVRAFRLDALLANGRTGLGLQIPTIALWYVGLFYSLLFDVFSAAVLLQSLLPEANRDGCIWLSIIIVGLLAASSLSSRNFSLIVADWLFVVQSALLSIAMLNNLRPKGDTQNV